MVAAAAAVEDAGGGDLKEALRGYGEALTSGERSRVREMESFLKSMEDEKEALSRRAAALAVELREARARARRVGAEFESFREEVEEERLCLSRDVRAEIAESLLPIWESFGRRAGDDQVEAKTAGEEEICRSYRSIYRHFGEVLSSLGFIDRQDDRPTAVRDVVAVGSLSLSLASSLVVSRSLIEELSSPLVYLARPVERGGWLLLRALDAPAVVDAVAAPPPPWDLLTVYCDHHQL